MSRSSSALVATVVPILTAAMAPRGTSSALGTPRISLMAATAASS